MNVIRSIRGTLNASFRTVFWQYLFIALVGFLLYLPSLGNYFQQDEWYVFGKIQSLGSCGIWCLLRPSGFHFIPLSAALVYVFYNLFGYYALPYALYALLTHIVNSLLIYHIGRKFLTNGTALIAALFFLTFAQSNQSVTWFAAAFAVLPASFFMLLSLLSYLESHKKGIWYLVFAYTSLFIALLFKEDAIVMVPVFLLISLLFKKEYMRAGSVILFAGVYLAFRFGSSYFFSVPGDVASGGGMLGLHTAQNLLVMPLSLMAGGILRERDVLRIGHALVTFLIQIRVLPTQLFPNQDIFAENVSYTLVAPAIGLLMFAGIAYWLRTNRNLILFIFLLMLSCAVPYVVLPSGLRLESRHFYLAGIGLAYLVGFIVMKQNEEKISGRIITGIVVLLFVSNLFAVRENLAYSLALSKRMAAYVHLLIQAAPTITSKTVLVQENDPPPLYSGVGYVAMVLYGKKYQYADFLRRDELWNWGSEGYFAHGPLGFGYYLGEASYRASANIPTDVRVIRIHWNASKENGTIRL